MYAILSGRLSQPTVFACTLFLLIVMHLDQTQCNKMNVPKIVLLYHEKSLQFVTIHGNGSVNTQPDAIEFKQNQCLELQDAGRHDFTFNIYNKATGRYLCFNHAGRLRGLRQRKKRNSKMQCTFKETVNRDLNGFDQFESVPMNNRGKKHYLAFTSKGEPSKKASLSRMIKMYNRCNDVHSINTTQAMKHSINATQAMKHKTRHHRREKKNGTSVPV